MSKVIKNPNPGQINPLFLGFTDAEEKVEISDASLINNGLVIIGTKNTGKSSMVPNIFQQEIIAPFDDDQGVHYYPKTPAAVIAIAAKRDQSYTLYAIAKKRSTPTRMLHLLKPSVNYAVKNTLLGMKEYKYDAVNDIIDFTNVIQNKETVIIDMETERYGEASVQAVGMLLMQLQIAMHNTSMTGKRRCYLIIDDAAQYLPYLDNILTYGSEYNVSTILIFSSRRQYAEYAGMIEDNLQNYLLMPNLSYDDAVYFSKKYFLDSPRDLIGQGTNKCFLASYDDTMMLHTDRINLEYLLYDPHQADLMRMSGEKYKKQLNQNGSDEEYIATIMKAYAYYIVQQNQRFQPGTATEAVAEMLQSGRDRKIMVDDQLPDSHTENPTIIARVQPQQIPANEVGPTVKNQESVKGAGINALLGAVQAVPPRLQKKLEKAGITAESIKAAQSPEPSAAPSQSPEKENKPHQQPTQPKEKHQEPAAQTQHSSAGAAMATKIMQERDKLKNLSAQPDKPKQAEGAKQPQKQQGKPKKGGHNQPKENNKKNGGNAKQGASDQNQGKKKNNRPENKEAAVYNQENRSRQGVPAPAAQPSKPKHETKNPDMRAKAAAGDQSPSVRGDTSTSAKPEENKAKSENHPRFSLEFTDDAPPETKSSPESVLDMHQHMAAMSDIPKSADAEFDANTKKFLKMLQNQRSRPSYFAQTKEIEEAQKRFPKH